MKIKISKINGVKIITVTAELWRSLWAEMLTYRRASRNASSNRVLRFNSQPKFLEPILTEQTRGMQVGSEVSDTIKKEFYSDVKKLYNTAVKTMIKYENIISRSILNRYIEPFTKINFIFTADESSWQHIFEERVFGENVEPNMRAFISEIYNKYILIPEPENSNFHIPMFDDFEITDNNSLQRAILISAARCARISYTPFGISFRDSEEDINLAQRLIKLKHYTPFEHSILSMDVLSNKIKPHPFISGNLVSVRQILETYGTIKI